MSSPRVLVVDDSKTLRVQVEQILTAAGYKVVTAASGADGIACVKEHCPHLLILDIQMPDMDGYTVCQELKRLGPPWDQLKVIFLTSLESHALDLLGDQLGAYVRKPVSTEGLLAVVTKFIEPHRGAVTINEPVVELEQLRAFI